MEAYFRNHGKLVKTANDLFIHRNTLNYRIKKSMKLQVGIRIQLMGLCY
ncbi:helix-turn-helix domain-containing protein [Staphylococcus pseudintermedius]